jgi:hypothetical protein
MVVVPVEGLRGQRQRAKVRLIQQGGDQLLQWRLCVAGRDQGVATNARIAVPAENHNLLCIEADAERTSTRRGGGRVPRREGKSTHSHRHSGKAASNQRVAHISERSKQWAQALSARKQEHWHQQWGLHRKQ